MDNNPEIPVSKKRSRIDEQTIAANSGYHFFPESQSGAAAPEFHQAKVRSLAPASMLHLQLPPAALSAAGPSYSHFPANIIQSTTTLSAFWQQVDDQSDTLEAGTADTADMPTCIIQRT
jgi:hypothetical protein